MKSKYFSVAIVGAGNIGIRHLQGLSQSCYSLKIYVVDPNKSSLNKARQHFIDSNCKSEKIPLYIDNISKLPNEIDLIIMATTADVRFMVTEELLKKKIKYLIFEKIVFQRPKDFDFIQFLLKQKKVKAWVNCTRRAYPIYKQIKNEYVGGKLFLSFNGNNWGMACNSIHMIDLLVFFSGQTYVKIDTNELENIIYFSKRNESFKEIKGTLKVETRKGHKLHLIDNPVYKGDPEIKILFNDFQHKIIEQKSILIKKKSDRVIYKKMLIIGKIVDQIFEGGDCDLSPYDECSVYHILMLNAFNTHFSNIFGKNITRCPIT